MPASPDWLPTIGADTAADAIGDGLQQLTDSGTLQAAAGVATAEPTLLVGSAVIGTLAKTELVEYSRKADRRLTQFIEETDEDEHAYLVKIAAGVSHLLPEGFGDAAIDAARGDPDNLRRLLNEYYAGEGRAALDDAVRGILTGDVDDLDEQLCEAFGTDDVYEAQALFLDFRDIIESRQVQETLETALDLEGQFADLQDEMAQTRKQLRSGFRGLLRRDLRDEGFVYVAPVEFDREIEEPEAAWRAGFDLVHVRGIIKENEAGGGENRTKRESFAADREGIGDSDRTATDELLAALRAGENRMIVGRAGSGKSTISKSVACEWYDDPDTGAVFYRRSGGTQAFESVGSLVEAVREHDGHALVVVEDAAREENRAVYEAIAQLQGESVSFLLDARQSDLNRFDGRGGPGALETDRQGELRSAFENITRYSLADQLTEDEVKAVFNRFEATTGRKVRASAEHVHDELQRGGDIGQMLFISYYLPVGGGGGGLMQDVENKYRTITGKTDGREHWSDITGFDSDLRQDVALTTALLVATGVGNYDELVHALCERHGREKAVHEEITEIRAALEDWFVYPTDDPDAEVPATTHELWATLYLQQEAEAFIDEREHRDRSFGSPTPNRFHTCLTTLYAVADDETCREYLRGGYRDSGLLERVDDDPEAFGERIATSVLELGEDRPALAPLFEFGTEREVPAPSVCDRAAVSRIERQKGDVCQGRGMFEQANSHYQRSRELSEDLGDCQGLAKSFLRFGHVALARGEYETARDYYQQASDLFEELDDQSGLANSLCALGNIAHAQREYDTARDYYQQASDLFEDLDDQSGLANSLRVLGSIVQAQGEYDTARDYLQQARDLFEDLGDREGLAGSFLSFGAVAQNQGNYNTARDYYQRGHDLFEDIGHRGGRANCLRGLGRVAREQEDYDTAHHYFERANSTFREISAVGITVITFDEIVDLCEQRDETEMAVEWCQRALDWAESVDQTDLSDAQNRFEARRQELSSEGSSSE